MTVRQSLLSALQRVISRPPTDMEQGMEEVAIASMGLGLGGLNYVHPSDVAAKEGLQIYDEMWRDTEIQSAISRRAQEALGRPWGVAAPPGSPPLTAESAAFCQENLELLGGLNPDGTVYHDFTESIFFSMLTTAIRYGYCVAELVWVYENGRWWINQLKPKDPKLFEFQHDPFGNLRAVKILDPTRPQLVEPWRFVLLSYMPGWNGVVGQSACDCIHREWWIKKRAWVLRQHMLAHKASGFLVGEYPKGWSRAQRQELLRRLKKLASQAVSIMEQGAAIKALEIATASRGEFKSAIDDLNRQMRIGLLGSTLTTEEGKTGSRSTATEQGDVIDRKVDFDCAMWKRGMSLQFVRPLCDANFSTADASWVYPNFRVSPREDAIDLDGYSRMCTRGVNLGMKLDQQLFSEKTGFPLAGPDTKPEDVIDIRVLAAQTGGENPTRQQVVPGAIPSGMANMRRRRRPPASFAQLTEQQRIERARAAAAKAYDPEKIDAQREQLIEDATDALATWKNESKKAVRQLLDRQWPTWKKAPGDANSFQDLPRRGKFEELLTAQIVDAARAGQASAEREVQAVAAAYSGRSFAVDDSYAIIPGEQLPDFWAMAEARAAAAAADWSGRAAGDLRNLFLGGLETGRDVEDMAEQAATILDLTFDQTKARIRTEISRGFNSARHSFFRNSPMVHGWEFDATIDLRTTEECIRWNGMRFRYDDPLAASLVPPLHYQCRSIERAVWWFDVEQGGFEWHTTTEDDLADIPALFGGRAA